ncbi:unnamed protein product [Ceratitis capitata]|uniref:(Mediterranean fruit fly) hypothetical protein n=1 Tax=Ceratitis capitata TaxID=7213 RepID=A0A811UZK1_CERCA|nr:unnamed protein product [Ceratitis capitata]
MLIAAKVAAHYRTKVDRQQIVVSRKCDKIAEVTVALPLQMVLLPATWHFLKDYLVGKVKINTDLNTENKNKDTEEEQNMKMTKRSHNRVPKESVNSNDSKDRCMIPQRATNFKRTQTGICGALACLLAGWLRSERAVAKVQTFGCDKIAAASTGGVACKRKLMIAALTVAGSG